MVAEASLNKHINNIELASILNSVDHLVQLNELLRLSPDTEKFVSENLNKIELLREKLITAKKQLKSNHLSLLVLE